MNPQIETLIMLQDLDLMIREMSDQKTASRMSEIGFNVEQIDNLNKARADLAGKIDLDLLGTYYRLMKRYDRAIAPMRDSICLGCFLKQPTRYSGSEDTLRTCSHCKRFLYFI